MIYKEKIFGTYTYLRHVQVEDAEFVLSLRTDPSNSRYINDTENDLDLQIEWIKMQQFNPNDYYFVICDLDNTCKGVISLYNFNGGGMQAEMGRLICPKSPIQLYEALILVLGFGFETLGLNRIFSRINPKNAEVLAFSNKIKPEVLGYGTYQTNNQQYIEFQLTPVEWPEFKTRNLVRLERFVNLMKRQQDRNQSRAELNSQLKQVM